MKKHLRLAVPPLQALTANSVCAFALLDRNGAVLRSGALPLNRLAAEVPVERLQVILAPDEVVIVKVAVPPLAARQLDAVLRSAIEPLALSDVDELSVAHGPRSAEGEVTAVWINRQTLVRAWAQLVAVGLNVAAFVPHELAMPADDLDPGRPLALPADVRWLAPLPNWSMADPALRPAGQSRSWRGLLGLGGLTALLWMGGLSIYAAQQAHEVLALQEDMAHTVSETFPQIPVVITPLKQASDARDALRRARGVAGGDDFMPIALGAAQVLGFAAGQVRTVHYADGKLTLTLADGYNPPGNEVTLVQAASSQALMLEKDAELAHTWHVRRAGAATEGARR